MRNKRETFKLMTWKFFFKWFSTHRLSNTIYHINHVKERNVIILTYAKNYKILHGFIIKTPNKPGIEENCLKIIMLFWNLWDPIHSNTTGLSVHQQLQELAHTHAHWVSDAIQPLVLCRPLLLLPSVFPIIRLFSNESVLRIRWPKYWSSSFSISPSVNIQDCFPWGLTGLIPMLSKGLSRIFSNTVVEKHQFFSAQLSLYVPTLTSIDDYWKNHSFD